MEYRGKPDNILGKLSIQIVSIWLIFAYLIHWKDIYRQTDFYAKADTIRLRDVHC